MKRYFLSPIIGTGTFGDDYRPKISDHGVSHVSVIPTGPDGQPTSDWALCLVEAVNFAPLLTDPALRALPDFPLDVRLSAMSTTARTAAESAVTHFGVAVETLNFNSGYRELVRSIGRTLEPLFDENNFDVAI